MLLLYRWRIWFENIYSSQMETIFDVSQIDYLFKWMLCNIKFKNTTKEIKYKIYKTSIMIEIKYTGNTEKLM
jgi:hypothetical protein